MNDRQILASLKIGDKIEFEDKWKTQRGKITKIRPKLAIGEAVREYEGYPSSDHLTKETIRMCKSFSVNGRKLK